MLIGSLVLMFASVAVALATVSAGLIGEQLTLSQALLTAGLAAVYGWHQVTGELLRGLRWVQLAGTFGAPPGGVGPAVGAISLVAVVGTVFVGKLTLESFLLIHLVIGCALCLPAAWGLYRAYAAIPQEKVNAEIATDHTHSFATMLLGTPSEIRRGTGNTTTDGRIHAHQYYFQDDFRVNS